MPVDAAFDLRYVPQAENAGEGEREIAEDDLTTAFYREGMLDVIELLREQFQLALPMKPLCSEACRGLCPVCGTNLNKGQCDCTPRWEDPRLAALKGLLTERRRIEDAQSETPAFEDAHRQAPHARRAEAGAVRHLPAVPGSQGAASGLPALRLLQGPPGQGGRRSVAFSLELSALSCQNGSNPGQRDLLIADR